MKKILLQLLGVLVLNTSLQAIVIPEENICEWNVPKKFSIKSLYKKNNTVVFGTNDLYFGIGKFNKKFSLATPYGKTISTARIYELIPHRQPIIVFKSEKGNVLGYLHLENSKSSDLFKPLKGNVYDPTGQLILKSRFDLTSQFCKIYSIQGDETELLAKTKGGEEDEVLIFLEENSLTTQINPLLLLSVIHAHACKNLLIGLTSYIAIDEIHIDDLAFFAEATAEQFLVKSFEGQQEIIRDEERKQSPSDAAYND